ncbi:MAG: histidine kinase [Solirubrobacteraceae bacterium]
MRRRELLVGCAGILAAVGAVWLAAGNPPDRPTTPGALLTLLVGASLIGSGLGLWRTRPENLLGTVMVVTGFAWFAGLLIDSSSSALYTIGVAVEYVFIAGFAYLILSFPSGRLETTLDRALVGAALALTTIVAWVALLFGNRSGLRCGPLCPSNAIQVAHDNGLALTLLNVQRVAGGVVLLITLMAVADRWVRASAPRRRAVAPVLVAGGAMLLALLTTIVDDLLGDPASSTPGNVFFYVSATVPVAIMFVFLQQRLARGMVAGLVVQLGEPGQAGDLRLALARALGDPSLELAYWYAADERYVTSDGRPVALPEPGSGRSSTLVEREGEPIAVLLHDPALEHNAELVRSVCAAAGLALENERLQAELRARLVELQASRARMVQATDAERRRIERDLHDGTQQRLVSIAMSLGLLESKLPDQAAEARPLVRETRETLALALQELRELTHGIRPPLLVEQGLSAALDELRRRSALPTRVDLSVPERLSDQIESAAYFFVSEALTNGAKHSHASQMSVSAVLDGGQLTVTVTDDGIGGATAAGGSGLHGLADRVEALGGRFTVSSPPGRGTILQAEIPCA